MPTLKTCAAIAVLALAMAAPAMAQTPNTLTAAEKKDGWKLLFDGKDLKGWRVYHKKDVSPEWQVQDGAIALTKGGAGDLMTEAEFGDFELSIDWKISPKGNSGVIYM